MLRLLRLWRIGGSDLRSLWFALRHPDRPVWLLPVVALLGVFALEPLNIAVPFLGIVDDFVILPLVLHVLLKFLPRQIRAAFAPTSPLRPAGSHPSIAVGELTHGRKNEDPRT